MPLDLLLPDWDHTQRTTDEHAPGSQRGEHHQGDQRFPDAHLQGQKHAPAPRTRRSIVNWKAAT